MSWKLQTISNTISTDLPTYFCYTSFYQALQKSVSGEDVCLENFPASFVKKVCESELDTQLRNMIYHWLQDHSSNFKLYSRESLEHFKILQDNWEQRLRKSIMSMSTNLCVLLARGRLTSEQETVEENWSEFSLWDVDLSKFKPVFSPRDFLDCMLQLSCPNYELNSAEKLWGSLVSFPIKLLGLNEMKLLLHEVITGEIHMGLLKGLENEVIGSNGSGFNDSSSKIFYSQRHKLGNLVQAEGTAAVAQEFLKKGCPRALRGALWKIILGSEITKEHLEYYQELKKAVIKCDLLVDRLILKDVHLTAANDDQYFVFEDLLYQVLLCFARDTKLLSLFPLGSKSPLTAKIRGRGGTPDTSVIYPPNGIIPFHGFTMYVAPLCYLYNDPESLYFTFRSFYSRYWRRFHEISSHPNGIVSLCVHFEKLLHRHETQLWFHLRSLRVLPLRIVFKWIMKGYSGYLPAEQVLQLWDLLLAYDCVHIMSLLAMGVLSIRKDNLMKAEQAQTVDAVLADLSSIRVLPVLQLALSREGVSS